MLDLLWIVASSMIFVCGIYYSFKLKFVHLNFKQMFKEIKNENTSKDGISSYQALAMSLAGKIGVGSLSGIALAIYLGGPRSIVLDMVHIFFLCNKYICRKCTSSKI